ncbi:MAG: hypothetical protein BWY88_01186 [Synergistetes bacterium ADurb.Bin520]|nr:MAG: hypothetical protein BWY88_01186 [Synergistetes bacterium ADurb.Bin520]
MGIAIPAPAFVVEAYHRQGHLVDDGVLDRQGVPLLGMPLDDGEFLVVQLSGLVEDLPGNEGLSQVVEQGADGDGLHRRRVPQDAVGQKAAQEGHVEGMDEGILVLLLHSPQGEGDLGGAGDLPGQGLPGIHKMSHVLRGDLVVLDAGIYVPDLPCGVAGEGVIHLGELGGGEGLEHFLQAFHGSFKGVLYGHAPYARFRQASDHGGEGGLDPS